MARILIVDDEVLMREMAGESLRRQGHDVVLGRNGQEGLELLNRHNPDLVLSDFKMPQMTGVEFLRRVRETHAEVPFVIMTAHGTVSVAVEAMRLGAWDFLEKPFEVEVLELTVARALEAAALRSENKRLRSELGERYRIVGTSDILGHVQRLIEEVAPTRTTVLIQGESGTGKELVARAIHAQSNRRDKPFVKVNCAALPESLFESELFGHEKGSFTGAIKSQRGKFELADGGTLLLDEVTEMPLGLQAKLLRVLQEREIQKIGSEEDIPIDVRLVCTTNRELHEHVAAGNFREDLFYRLNVIPFRVPPLRERPDDIIGLVSHFIDRYNRENGFAVEGLSDAALKRLLAHDWPGNIRELENTIQRAVVLTKRGQVPSENLGPVETPVLSRRLHAALPVASAAAPTTAPATAAQAWTPPPPTGDSPFLGQTLDQIERLAIEATLTEAGGNRTRAAERLGISIRTLRNKLREYRGDAAEGDDDE
jgi:DNA-binding NtrC family response regulator